MIPRGDGARCHRQRPEPAGLSRLEDVVPRITAQVIAAAKASGATLLMPGNVYVFGDQPGPWCEHTTARDRSLARAASASRWSNPTQGRGARRRAHHPAARRRLSSTASRPGPCTNMVVLKSLRKGRIESMGAPDVRRTYATCPTWPARPSPLPKVARRLPVRGCAVSRPCVQHPRARAPASAPFRPGTQGHAASRGG